MICRVFPSDRRPNQKRFLKRFSNLQRMNGQEATTKSFLIAKIFFISVLAFFSFTILTSQFGYSSCTWFLFYVGLKLKSSFTRVFLYFLCFILSMFRCKCIFLTVHTSFWILKCLTLRISPLKVTTLTRRIYYEKL